MIKAILFNLERAIKYLENLKMKLPGQEQEPQKDTLTKREQCVNLIKKMARQMDFPAEIVTELDNLGEALLAATDEQVGIILNHLTDLINDVEKAKQHLGIDFKKALSIYKTQNN